MGRKLARYQAQKGNNVKIFTAAGSAAEAIRW